MLPRSAARARALKGHVYASSTARRWWRAQAHIPEGLSLLELDIIKLAAQFVARNGQTFLTGLSSREHTNPQFAFLRPTHSLFGLFKTLCDAYSRVLMPPKGTKDRLLKDATDG